MEGKDASYYVKSITDQIRGYINTDDSHVHFQPHEMMEMMIRFRGIPPEIMPDVTSGLAEVMPGLEREYADTMAARRDAARSPEAISRYVRNAAQGARKTLLRSVYMESGVTEKDILTAINSNLSSIEVPDDVREAVLDGAVDVLTPEIKKCMERIREHGENILSSSPEFAVGRGRKTGAIVLEMVKSDVPPDIRGPVMGYVKLRLDGMESPAADSDPTKDI